MRWRSGRPNRTMNISRWRAGSRWVQSSTYNSRLLVPEVLVRDGAFHVVRPRGTYEELIGLDRLPPWLAAECAPGLTNA